MRSIQRHLGLWVLGASGLGALLLGLLFYFIIYTELNEAKDNGLMLVATSVADQGEALEAAAQATPRPAGAAQRTEIVVVTWSRDGRRLHSSNRDAALAFTDVEGLQRQRVQGEDWDVHTAVRFDRIVQAGQRAAAQQEEAAESAATLLLPFALLIAVIGAFMIFALRRGLRPLDAAASDIAARSAASLASIDDRDMPREILPLVRAINGLMAKLAAAFARQRLFVAEAAHELRTPVTALRLQLQLLEGARDEPARLAATAELRDGVERTQRLIEQLLQMSRIEPGGATRQMSAVALDDVARAATARFSALAVHRQIDLGAKAEQPVVVPGDAHELDTLVDNLIDNALRYTPGGGVVDVVVESLHGRPTLRVIDSGPGIAADERERVFDRFHRGDNAPSVHGDTGSGLGLAIVRAIAERHGASVSLHRAASGQGLEARVVFGAAAAA